MDTRHSLISERKCFNHLKGKGVQDRKVSGDRHPILKSFGTNSERNGSKID